MQNLKIVYYGNTKFYTCVKNGVEILGSTPKKLIETYKAFIALNK